MEKSMLENIGNSQLFFILYMVNENHEYNKFSLDDITDDKFIRNCDRACKYVGIDISGIDYVDYNFILATLLINEDYDFTSPKPSGVIKKPTSDLYSFDINEHRVEYVTRTYQHEVTSYLTELTEPTINAMLNNDTIEYYNGYETNTNYYDGETTDVDLDSNSIKKIK
jgi:hypothetical protein